jgi:hypothetical protein
MKIEPRSWLRIRESFSIVGVILNAWVISIAPRLRCRVSHWMIPNHPKSCHRRDPDPARSCDRFQLSTITNSSIDRCVRTLGLVSLSAALVLCFSTSAIAAVRWRGDFATGNLRQWYMIQCGGQGGSCPCTTRPPGWCGGPNPTDPGTCPAATSPSPPPQTSRFQVVTPPGRPGPALQLELRYQDFWPCPMSSPTVRNELVYSQEQRTFTIYQEGDDRFFAWSLYFPSQYWTTNQCIAPCTHGPWNAVFQLHSGEGSTRGSQLDMGPGQILNNDGSWSNTYNLSLEAVPWEDPNITIDWNTKLWYDGSPATPMALDTWYDFILHVYFSASQPSGVLELWVGRNGGPKTKQILNCPYPNPQNPTVCNFNLLTTGNPGSILKSGHYRNEFIANTTFLYHSGVVVGDAYPDVSLAFTDARDGN